MAQPVSSVSVYKGRYHRTIGKVLGDNGQLVPKKFLLGTDRVAAEVANGLLEQLWAKVVAEHAASERFIREMGDQLVEANLVTGETRRTEFQRGKRKRDGWSDAHLPPSPKGRTHRKALACTSARLFSTRRTPVPAKATT
jgi:hypothetical protein